ncbi:MAG: hypothetical protein KJ578_05035 [Bacteroidetes bacterium]|jgi:hypothetical protein|nr:hypothetical protein [Bacteroidota bacterium]MDA3944141.1 hypothetical protein [Bacteroidota bacterium]
MKRIILFSIVISSILLSSCNDKYKKEIENLQAKNDSLIVEGAEKEAYTLEYVRSFNAIQSNLDSIKKMENIISNQSDNPEISKKHETDINRDIESIYQLLLKNKQIVDRMKKQLSSSGRQNSELELMINTLSEQIEAKDLELTQLKIDLSQKNLQIQDLEADLEEMEAINLQRAQEIEAKINQINTIHYIVGTKNTLMEQGIIENEGGFLGIGRTKKIVDNFDLSLFTEADMRQLSALPVFSKKAQLLSIHPLESYTFINGEGKQIDSLKILHADDFWSATKKLVLLID